MIHVMCWMHADAVRDAAGVRGALGDVDASDFGVGLRIAGPGEYSGLHALLVVACCLFGAMLVRMHGGKTGAGLLSPLGRSRAQGNAAYHEVGIGWSRLAPVVVIARWSRSDGSFGRGDVASTSRNTQCCWSWVADAPVYLIR